jgi:hypothetical protein
VAMLRVRHRERLPRGWSFPLGAEVLTEALAGVPHGVPEPLWFAHSEPMWLKDRRKRESDDLPLQILEVEFTTWALGVEPPPERPLWTIRVGSVPSHLRQWSRSCLIEEALPRVRRWLLQPFPDTALEATPQCRVLLQAEQKRLLWEERSSRFADARVEELRAAKFSVNGRGDR